MKRGENREILLQRTTISESQPEAQQKVQRTALSYTVRKRKETTEKPFEKRRKHRDTFRTNNNKRKPADGESKSQPEAQQERTENSTELHCQKEKWKQKINKGHPN